MGRRIAGVDDWPPSRCCWTSEFCKQCSFSAYLLQIRNMKLPAIKTQILIRFKGR